MSQYLILARTTNLLYKGFEYPCGQVYALTTSNHPPTGLSYLQNYCPLTLEIVHVIHSRNQTEILEQTLRIKFRDRLLHSFWYTFTPKEISLIKSLNEQNFSNMIGFIQRELKRPEMNREQLEQFVSEQLQKAESAL